MKIDISHIRRHLSEQTFLYPILTGILFVIKVLHNDWLISSFVNKIFLTIIVIVFCLTTVYITRLFIQNKTKASLIATLFIVISLYFQYFLACVNEPHIIKPVLGWLDSSYPERYILFILGIIGFGIIIIIIRTRKNLSSLNLYFNTLFSILLVFKIGTIIFTKPFTIELIYSPNQHTGGLVNSIIKDKPNIYFILLDSYTSSASLDRYWDYDNSPFESSLSKVGFFCTHSSKSDYDFTPYCMASYLNMSLLKLSPKLTNNELWLQPKFNTLDLIKNDIVVKQIVNSGYTFVNYSIFEIGKAKPLYQAWSNEDSNNLLDLLKITIWPTILSEINVLLCIDSPPTFQNLKVFILLGSVADRRKTPFFVYGHIMMPHPPFEYDENGNRTRSEDRNSQNNKLYLNQLIYTNKLVLNTIKKILITEKKKPIIIIQGDHGYRFFKTRNSKIQRTEAHTIFSSYLLPDDLNRLLNDSIKPVQAFSLLFNKH